MLTTNSWRSESIPAKTSLFKWASLTKRGSLYYQCRNQSVRAVCEALAEVYYAAVRAFGGDTQGRRDDDLVRVYDEKMAIYNKLVAEAQESGELWQTE